MAGDSVVKEIGDQLGGIFRHMLPGILVVGAARVAHPRWFAGLCLTDPRHLVVLAAIALLAGNAWYVLHRFTVHQVIDVFLCPTRKTYASWLAEHVDKSHRFPDDAADLGAYVRTRSAQVIFLFILAEVEFAFTCWPATGTFFARYAGFLKSTAALLFVFAVWQHYLSHRIDVYAVEQHGGKKPVQSG